MVYKIASEAAIRNYINDKIAEYDSELSSLPSRTLSSEYTAAERDEDIQYAEKLKQSKLNSLVVKGRLLPLSLGTTSLSLLFPSPFVMTVLSVVSKLTVVLIPVQQVLVLILSNVFPPVTAE